ncbi:MAG: enoyl-CoA hydratase/isomerase family protein [Solirubrobacterales bacterium]
MLRPGDFEAIAVGVEDGGLAVLTLNRPEAENRVDDRMHSELAEVFAAVRRDKSILAVVLTGAGDTFCAGGDGGPDRRFETFTGLTPIEEGQAIVDGILALDQPLVAAVNGDALGLGAILATLADAAFAVPGARIGDRHVAGGVTAGNGSAALWPLLVGLNRTKQLLLGAEVLDAATAVEAGLITALAADPLAAAREQAAAWAAMPAYALQSTKRALNQHLRAAVADVMPLALALEEQSLARLDPRFRPWAAEEED